MADTLILDLLRHGRCDDGEIYRGRTDSVLTERGVQQMFATLNEFGTPVWQQVLSSPLQRCASVATRLAESHGLPLCLEEDLQELDFGSWDGQPLAQVWQQQEQQVLAFWQDPEINPPPGGESLAAMRARLQRLIETLLEQTRRSPESELQLLCVTHGGVIRTLVMMLLQLPMVAAQQLSLDYGSLSRIELYPDNNDEAGADSAQPGYHAQLVFFNRLPRLENYA